MTKVIQNRSNNAKWFIIKPRVFPKESQFTIIHFQLPTSQVKTSHTEKVRPHRGVINSVFYRTKQPPLKYLFFTMSCQRPFSWSSFHHHLQRRLIFIFLIFLMSKPPFSLLWHIVLHLTRWYFLLRLLPSPTEGSFLLVKTVSDSFR